MAKKGRLNRSYFANATRTLLFANGEMRITNLLTKERKTSEV